MAAILVLAAGWTAASAVYKPGARGVVSVNTHASDLIDKRDDVQREFRTGVEMRIVPYGLALDAVATTRFNFSYAYAEAAQLNVASVQRTLEAQ